MVEGVGQMYITGPDVIRSVTGEDVSHEELGGAAAHAAKSGVAHFAFANEQECFAQIARLLSFLPQNNMEEPPRLPSRDDAELWDEGLAELVPDNPNQPYDMLEVIGRVVDDGEFMQVHERFAGKRSGRLRTGSTAGPSASSRISPSTWRACSTLIPL